MNSILTLPRAVSLQGILRDAGPLSADTFVLIAGLLLALVLNIVCVVGVIRLNRKFGMFAMRVPAAPEISSVSVSAPLAPRADAGVSSELVAVISAAIAAAEAAAGASDVRTAPYPGFIVKSIRRI